MLSRRSWAGLVTAHVYSSMQGSRSALFPHDIFLVSPTNATVLNSKLSEPTPITLPTIPPCIRQPHWAHLLLPQSDYTSFWKVTRRWAPPWFVICACANMLCTTPSVWLALKLPVLCQIVLARARHGNCVKGERSVARFIVLGHIVLPVATFFVDSPSASLARCPLLYFFRVMKQLFAARQRGHRKRGRPAKRWEDDINSHLQPTVVHGDSNDLTNDMTWLQHKMALNETPWKGEVLLVYNHC